MTNKERMNQIGEVMDELAKLGFEIGDDIHILFLTDDGSCDDFHIEFTNNAAWAIHEDYKPFSFPYESTNWQQDLLNKVKTLISFE
jgi:hypothetical protein